MSRRAWLLTALLILILLPVGAVGLAVALVDPNDWKPEIEAAVQKATGRALTLEGPIHISRSLWPVIDVSKVRLANLPGGSRSYMVRVDRIRAQVNLLALLRQRIEITHLDLTGPNILFEEVNHQPNWLFGAAGGAPAQSAKASSGWFHPKLRIRDAHIKDGMVTFRLPARTNVIGIRSLDVRHTADGAPVDLTSTLVYSDFAPFDLSVHAVPAGHVMDPWQTQIHFSAFNSTADAKGTMSLAGNFSLAVSGKTPALEKLNALLPAMQLPPLHGFSFQTHIANGPVRGDIPVIGGTTLHIGSADLTHLIPGLVLGAVDATLDKPGGTASVKGEGRYAGEPFSLSGSTGVPEHLDGKNTVAVTLDATALAADKARLRLQGKLALDTTQFAGLQAEVQLDTPKLAKLRPLVSPALPALTNAHFTGGVTLPANLGSITLTKAKLTAAAGDLAGDATFGLGGGVRVKARLTANRLDLDALLDALGIGLGTPAPAGKAGPVFSNQALPWANLRGPDLDVSADVGTLDFQKQSWRKVGLAVRLQNGHLALDRMQLALPGGPVQISFAADATAKDPSMHLLLHAPDVPVALILQRFGLPGAASGTLKVDADLSARGASPHAIAASLSGSLSATMGAGSLSNAALVEIAGASLKALNISVPAKGETRIRCFGIVGKVVKGVARLSTLALDSTYLQMDGQGEVDLGRETLALKLKPLARVSGSSVSVPVVVEGPFRSAQGRLDAGGLAKVGIFVDALFGGDTPATCANAGLLPGKS
ncbi:MAG TPA: AsmA family protein [Acidisoma sp.]|uniref:AsmA family protein n=1 Tax=Acidisoma sp. TaxID=1872115 RepID=UPI002C4D7F47|nr:AsmA family protein [Acidisoma sp.]HTI02327.1 AsmA family protein [Acidisoma sp.]